ncbi:MAG: hypothetical protein EA378_10860 [Phycisphaerales bacterium]|nr:MAG: hypothetical protein EA378_10860 [Phycisphaerales bacterium]
MIDVIPIRRHPPVLGGIAGAGVVALIDVVAVGRRVSVPGGGIGGAGAVAGPACVASRQRREGDEASGRTGEGRDTLRLENGC